MLKNHLITFTLIYLMCNCIHAFSIANNADDGEDSELFVGAVVHINTTSSRAIRIYINNVKCKRCKFRLITELGQTSLDDILFLRLHGSYNIIVENKSTREKYCRELETKNIYWGLDGEYAFEILQYVNDDKSEHYECILSTIREPCNWLLPLIIAPIVLILIAIIFTLFKFLYKKRKLRIPYLKRETTTEGDREIKKSTRLKSIDTFRGVTLAIMIFVNYGAGEYEFLSHVPWNGLHLADVVYPWFIFIMGLAIPLSFNSIAKKLSINDENVNKMRKFKKFILKIIKRSILLFLIGLAVENTSTSLAEMRILGILQRISICYFVCSLMELVSLHCKNYAFEAVDEEAFWKKNFKELVYYPFQWLFILVLAILWILIIFLLPVPNCPKGYLGPGGTDNYGRHAKCTGGAAGYIDRVLLSASHLNKQPLAGTLYGFNSSYDEEGVLGTLNAIFLTYLGVSAGHIFINYKEDKHRYIRFIVYSLAYGLIGLILCKFKLDDSGWIPINRSMTSTSFVLVTTSLALLMVIILYLLVDVFKVYSGIPFVYLGTNSLSIFILHFILRDTLFVQFAETKTYATKLANNIYGVFFWIFVSTFMYYKKIFIKI